MNLSRLCRLLKPALLCGALAAPGLASAMVSATLTAELEGRWGGRVAFTATPGATVTLGGRAPSAAHVRLLSRRWIAQGPGCGRGHGWGRSPGIIRQS